MSSEPHRPVPETESTAYYNGKQRLPIEANCNSTTVNLLDPLSSTKRVFNLDELSNELERQTRATQILQDEVDFATKVAMESACHTNCFNSTPSQISHLLPVFKKDGSPDINSDIATASKQSVIQPNACLDSTDLVVAREGVFFPGKDVLESAIVDYSQQVSELQRQQSESHVQHEQQKFSFRQTIIKLQTKLQELQMEKDALSDLRLKESKTQIDLIGKMQGVMRELQSTKLSGDHKLQEAEESAKILKRKAESMEHTIQEVFSTLRAHEKQKGDSSLISQDTTANPSHLPLGAAVEKKLQDLEYEKRTLQETFLHLEEKLISQQNKWQVKEESIMKEHHEGIEKLITSHNQEVTLLTDKLSTSRSNTASLKVKLELLQNHAESQTSVHDCQVREFESTISILRSDLMNSHCNNKDKVVLLEQQLSQAQTQVEVAQHERERSLKQAEELSSQISNLTLELQEAEEKLAREKDQSNLLRDCTTSHSSTIEELQRKLEQRSQEIQQLENLVGSLKENCKAEMEAHLYSEEQQCLLQEEVNACRGELEAAREQLQQAQAEEALMQALLKEREEDQEEMEQELRLRRQEVQQGCGRLQEAQSRCQAFRAEAEVLRLKLDDREKVVEILHLQMDSGSQAAVQHDRIIDSLHQENSHLSSQLKQHKLEIQHLQTDLGQREADLVGLQRERELHQADLVELQKERDRQQVHLDELSCCARTLTVEKQQLTAELEVQRMQLARLDEEQEELNKVHNHRNEEQEGKVSKLRTLLQTTRSELEQTRSTLRTLEGTDGHGMQVAMGMQKTITAKREQIDSLQGRIQTLEETMEKLSQEKRYQSLESKRQDRELTSIREEKRQLAVELEVRSSMERQLRDQVAVLETSLHKMSESFADCQDFIQLQEQETARLKLEYALDLKELQGHCLRSTRSTLEHSVTPSSPATKTALGPTLQASKCLIKAQQLQESPARELRSLVKELQGVISENPAPHTVCSSGVSAYRRRSTPEKVHGTTYKFKEETKWLESNAKGTKDVHSSSESSLPSVHSDLDSNSPVLSESRNSSTGLCMPFYTSSPNPLAHGCRSPVHSLLTSETHPTHLSPHRMETASASTEMSSFIKGQERKMRHVKEKGRLYNKHATEQ